MTRQKNGLITHLVLLSGLVLVPLFTPACTDSSGDNFEVSETIDTPDAPPGGGETETQTFELGDCLATLDCDAVDLTVHGFSAQLDDCLSRSCVPRTAGPGLTCRFSFTGECLEGTPEGTTVECLTNTDCADSSACTSDLCIAGECVNVLSTDPGPVPATPPQCLLRSCNTTTGVWGYFAANEGGVCNDGDTCTNASVCMAGTCVGSVDPTNVICCDAAVDCASNSCPMGEDPTCSIPLGESGTGRCGCDGFTETSCYDGQDSDGDSLVDCTDPDCSDEDICNTERGSCCAADLTAGCNDTTGQNFICTQYYSVGDGDEYCCEGRWDQTCVNEYKLAFPGVCTPPPAEVCNDGIDNDLDTLVDCADSSCAAFAPCIVPPPAEVCNDGIDNDLDTLTDCADPNCATFPACVPAPTWLSHPAGTTIICWGINPTSSGRVPGPSVTRTTPALPSAFAALCNAGGLPTQDLLCYSSDGIQPFLATQSQSTYGAPNYSATYGNGTGFSSRAQVCATP